jgi:hypothetical protein
MPAGRPRRRWKDNTKINLEVVGFGVWMGFIWLTILFVSELLSTQQ